MFVVKVDRSGRAALKLLKEMPRRLQAAQRYLAYEVARRTHADIVARIPGTPEYDSLRNALELVRGNSTDPIYAIRARPQKTPLQSLDASTTVVYVRPRRLPVMPPPEVLVLEEFNPWTLDTLPFKPDKKHAEFVHRKVSEVEVRRTRERRRRDRPKWRHKLASVGVRVATAANVLDLSDAKSAGDYTFDSLNLEFGLGKRSAPHWRPALQNVARGKVLETVVQSRTFRQMFQPGSQGWKRWVAGGESLERVSLAELKDYEAFQKKLGIRT